MYPLMGATVSRWYLRRYPHITHRLSTDCPQIVLKSLDARLGQMRQLV